MDQDTTTAPRVTHRRYLLVAVVAFLALTAGLLTTALIARAADVDEALLWVFPAAAAVIVVTVPVGVAALYLGFRMLEDSEAQLRESEERYRRFFEEDLTGDFVSRPDGTIVECNPALARMLGYERVEEVVGRDARDFWPSAETREAMLDELRQNGRVERFEAELRRRDGAPLHIIENAVGIFDEVGELQALRGYIFDITEHRATEERLHQVQKLEAIGRLAGGVAHDFNNILTAIRGYTEFALGHIPPDHPARPELEEVLACGDRAMALTRQLLAFGRKQVLSPRVLDLNEVIIETSSLLERLIGADVEIETDLDTELHSVLADPVQLQQVLVNLAVNSRDAMPRGGRLTIVTRNRTIEAPGPPDRDPSPGEYAELQVADTGEGMDDATRERIFEPFFTTKEKGEGTGLGLATVYGIMKQSGGYIYCESSPGEGTVFRLYLPRREESLREGGAPGRSSPEEGGDPPPDEPGDGVEGDEGPSSDGPAEGGGVAPGGARDG